MVNRAEVVDVPYPRQPTIQYLSPPAIYAAVVEHGAEKVLFIFAACSTAVLVARVQSTEPPLQFSDS